MKKSTKKGFTIVELVVVIAIIAILAAVLIPTFSSLIKKANASADKQLVRNLNTALLADAAINGKHATMQDALDAVKNSGFDVARINETKASDNEILWDSKNDLFCYFVKDGGIEYLPDQTPREAASDVDRWIIVTDANNISNKYSNYLYKVKKDSVEVKTGVDIGDESIVGAITYTGSASGQEVVIRTNGGYLTINAAADTVKHYGEAEILDIQAINTASYHEFGKAGLARLKQGHFVVEAEGVVNVLYATGPKSGDTRVVVDNNNGTIGKAYATVTETANIYNGAAQEGQSGNVTLEKYDAVITEAVVTAMNSESIVEVLASEDSSVAAVKETIEAAVESSAFLGEGTEANPYIISSVNDLVKLSQKVAGGNSYEGEWFALSKNIDMKDVLWGVTTEIETINCIGTSTYPFKGNFDGKGHTVMNLTNGNRMTSDTYTNPTSRTVGNIFGLFGYVAGGTQENPLVFKNLNVTIDADIPDGKSCAALIAALKASGHISLENITVSGNLFARNEKAAGFIGSTNAQGSSVTMTKCVNEVNIKGTQRISGFISQTGSDGGADVIRFINCQNKGKISLTKVDDDYQTGKYGVAAGFISHSNGADIEYDDLCFNSGAIEAPLAANFHTYVSSSITYNGNGTWKNANTNPALMYQNTSLKNTLGMVGVYETETSKAYFKLIESAWKIYNGFDGVFYHSNSAYSVFFYGDNRFESPNYCDIAAKYTADEWNAKTDAANSNIEHDGPTMTIILQQDLNWSALYSIGTSRTLIIDLNGYTLTATSSILSGCGATKFTFKNGTINAEGVTLVSGSGYSEVNFENVTGSYIDQ